MDQFRLKKDTFYVLFLKPFRVIKENVLMVYLKISEKKIKILQVNVSATFTSLPEKYSKLSSMRTLKVGYFCPH